MTLKRPGDPEQFPAGRWFLAVMALMTLFGAGFLGLIGWAIIRIVLKFTS